MISLRDAIGKPVIDIDSAEKAGDVRGFAIDAGGHRVTALLVTGGRSTSVVEWAEIQSVGPDAVIISSVRQPTADEERMVSGALNPIDKRVLSDLGNDLGHATDAEVDDDGVIQSLDVAGSQVHGQRVRGIGSYALVVAADPGEA